MIEWLTGGLVLMVSVWQFAAPFLDPGSREAKQGLALMQSGDWVGAAEAFSEARSADEDPIHAYNLGTAAFRGQNFKGAAEAFQASAGSPAVPPGDAAYNLGNTLVEGEDLATALDAYRAALRENPDHEDARYNYELVQRLLEQQEQEQEQQDEEQEQNEENEDQEGQDNPSQGAPPDSSQQNDQQPDQPNQDGESEPSPPDSSQSPQPQEPQDSDDADPQDQTQPQPLDPEQLLSPEDARKLLDQITPSERDLIRQRLQGARKKAAEKDW